MTRTDSPLSIDPVSPEALAALAATLRKFAKLQAGIEATRNILQVECNHAAFDSDRDPGDARKREQATACRERLQAVKRAARQLDDVLLSLRSARL